jgi:hypothetical protein
MWISFIYPTYFRYTVDEAVWFIELDLSKAYDRTSWLYLRLMLLHVGFYLPVANWKMGCISSISYVVLINRATTKKFKPSWGLRQDCPLSPLLFLFVVKDLSRVIKEAKRQGIITGIKIGKIVALTHLLFVDHVLLFSNGSPREARRLEEILEIG